MHALLFQVQAHCIVRQCIWSIYLRPHERVARRVGLEELCCRFLFCQAAAWSAPQRVEAVIVDGAHGQQIGRSDYLEECIEILAHLFTVAELLQRRESCTAPSIKLHGVCELGVVETHPAIPSPVILDYTWPLG